MRKQLSTLWILFMVHTMCGQVNFEKGYFINQSNEKTECFIKNMDWKNNPEEFTYTISENGKESIASLATVKEFAVTGSSKYIRATVAIDRSTDKIAHITDQREPKFNTEQLFLKVLIEGEASLYSYDDKSLIRYFYKTKTTDLEQLVYKRYKVSSSLLAKNNRYQQQIFNALKCDDISESMVKNMQYEKKSLLRIFEKYNECKEVSFINFERKEKRDLFNVSLRPGVHNSSFSMTYLRSGEELKFDSEFGLRFGVESEFVLPFNNNKLALFVEPTYQYYKSQKSFEADAVPSIIDYSSIEIPMGFRYYSYLNDDFKLFFNTAAVLDFPLSKTLRIDNSREFLIGTTPLFNFQMGMGAKIKNTYSLEVRYGFHRNLLNLYYNWESRYDSFSLIFGYTLF